jgi:ligand-binding sensor domain-containing protein/signal transduction histidine kinase
VLFRFIYRRRILQRAALCFACALLLCARGTIAQPPSTPAPNPPANYSARIWQTQDGLPQQTVQAIAQTHDGFLWVGTTDGLFRFDGSRFVTLEPKSTQAFHENSVFALTTARDGTLWIGTEGGGLVRMRGDEFRHFGPAEGLLDGFVRSVLDARDGTVWIGTDNGLFNIRAQDPGHVQRVDASSNFPPIAVHALLQTADGAVWVGGSRLVALRQGVPTVYPLVGEYSETRIKSLLQTRDGTIWAGTVSGLQRLSPGAKAFERVPGIQGTVRALRETVDGTLWIGTIGLGAYTLRDGLITPIGSGDAASLQLPSRTVLSLFADAERNLWVGTQAGMVRFSRSPGAVVPLPNASDSDFETVSLDRDGTLWVAGTRLSHLRDGVATTPEFPQLNGARVRNVFRDREGALWIGTDGRGIFRIGSGPTLHFTTANGLVNNFIRAILETRSGDLWIATDEGVSRLANGELHNFSMTDGLAYFSVRALLEDKAGGLWIGTDRGLSHLVGNTFVHDPATAALADEKVWALNQSSSGAIWFGTRDNGLFRYLPGAPTLTHYTTAQGLASNSVYSILEDAHDRFWIGGAAGIEVFSIAALETFNQNPPLYLPQRFFAVTGGGDLSPLYGGTQPAAAMSPTGDAWFPTSKGPVRFSANDAGSAAVPQVFVDQIVADGRVLPANGGSRADRIVLSADNRNLEIGYGSLLLGPQDAVQFLYKLQGFDTDWRYGSNRRVADYTNLPAGPYTFRIQAIQGGSGRLTERTLAVYKRQYFFRTWWFLTLCAFFVTMVIWLLHRQHVRRVKSSFQAVLDERARLAREMHDTLIQGCAGVSLLLEACSVEAGSSTTQTELLDYARTQLASSIDEARQAVWDLRGQDSANFGDALRKLTERLDNSTHIDVQCRIEGEAYEFDTSASHEVSMASREAIYNALLHANPTRIEIRALFGEDNFKLTVLDNGSGFESTRIAPEGHYGLIGIQERIKRLGGTVEVNSAVSLGTGVCIQLPRTAVCTDRKRAETDTLSKAMK